MKIEITYPASGKSFDRRRLVRAARWPFLGAGAACCMLNLFLGGPVWSAVAVWGLIMVWTNVIALAMVDYNRLSQSVKLFLQSCVMLILVDVCLVPGKLFFVLPMVGFGGLTVLAVLFFSDMRRQQQNVMPLILLSVSLLCADLVGALVQKTWPWTSIVLGAVSVVLLVSIAAVLGKLLWTGLKKYFHLK